MSTNVPSPLLADYLALIRDTITLVQPHAPPPPKPIKKTIVPPKPDPIKPIPKQIKKPSFELHPMSAPPEEKTLFARFSRLLPNLPAIPSAPNDTKARRVKEAWRERKETPDIPILCADVRFKPFLEHVARAIECTFGPSRVVDAAHYERKQTWDLLLEAKNLRLILAQDTLIWNSSALMSHYRDDSQRFLGRVPLLLLPDLSLYMKDPFLKRSLWNVICTSLKSS